MKKILFIISVLCLLTGSIYGQKLKKKAFDFEYLQLPIKPLEGDFKSYSVHWSADSYKLARLGKTLSGLQKGYFNFANYTYKPSGGDFALYLFVDQEIRVDANIKSFQETIGKGENAKKITYYKYEVKLGQAISYELKDGARTTMREAILANNDNMETINWGKERSKRTLMANWIEKKDNVVQDWAKKNVDKKLSYLSNKFSSELDTRRVKKRVSFFTIKKAEKYKAEKIEKAMTKVESAMKKSIGGGEVADVTAGLQSPIKTWEEGLKKYKVTDKKQKRIYFACAYNLASAALHTGDFDNYKKYIKLADKADQKKFQREGLKSFAESLETRIAANENIPNKYTGAYDENATGNDVDAGGGTDLYQEYVITTELDTVWGEVTIVNKNIGLKRVIVNNENFEPAEKFFEPEEVIMAKAKGKMYHRLDLSIGKMTLGLALLEVVHRTDLAGLYRHVDRDGDVEYFLRRYETDKKTISTNAMLNLNKAIGKYFNDCPKIVANSKSKEYRKSETSLSKIIDEYTACKE